MARYEHLPIYKVAMDCCVYLERSQIRFFRNRLPGVVTLFRVGHYVELYDRDAKTVAALLHLKIRNGSRGMQCAAGFPCWFQERFIDRLLAAGQDVAVVAQGNSDPYVRQRYVREVYRCSGYRLRAGQFGLT